MQFTGEGSSFSILSNWVYVYRVKEEGMRNITLELISPLFQLFGIEDTVK